MCVPETPDDSPDFPGGPDRPPSEAIVPSNANQILMQDRLRHGAHRRIYEHDAPAAKPRIRPAADLARMRDSARSPAQRR